MEILHQLDAIASFLWEPIFTVLAILFTFEGTRLLAAGGASRRAIAMLVPSIFFFVFVCSVAVWSSRTLHATVEKLSLPVRAELSNNWGADQTPEAREKNSRAFASVVFVGSGSLVKYFDAATGWQSYHPSKEDLVMREQAIRTQSKLEQLSDASYTSALQNLVFGVSAFALGLYSGRKKAPNAG